MNAKYPKTQYKKKTRQARRVGRKVVTNRRRTARLPSRLPFPKVMNTQLVYKNPSVNVTSSGIQSFNYCNFTLNSMFDFDTTNIIGNKQPLFYDQLLSVDGPYKNYKVNAWKTTIRFINLSDRAMYVYYDPCSATISEADSALEMQNRRGVQTFVLTAANNAKPMCTITKYQSLRQFFPNSVNSSENFSAVYNASPATAAYSTLGWQTIDGSVTAYTIAVQVQHIFYCTLYNADSVNS